MVVTLEMMVRGAKFDLFAEKSAKRSLSILANRSRARRLKKFHTLSAEHSCSQTLQWIYSSVLGFHSFILSFYFINVDKVTLVKVFLCKTFKTLLELWMTKM
jgi:hypothetical protein